MMALFKELQDRLIAFRDDEDKVTRAGWVSQGATQMDPVWHYSVWNPKEKNPPVSTSTLLSSLEVLFQNVAAPGVLQRFRGPVLDSWQTLRRLPLRLSPLTSRLWTNWHSTLPIIQIWDLTWKAALGYNFDVTCTVMTD